MDDARLNEDAYEIIENGRDSPWLIACDHASNRVPEALGGTLGLPPDDMARHIAFDLGAAGVARALAASLSAPTILSRFSRLVIDPNRGEDDPTLIMQVYDGTIVPGNRDLTQEARLERLDRWYRPYHAAYAERAGRRGDTLIVAVHSFTPRLLGRAPRPWHLGILFDPSDERLSRPFLYRLHAEEDLVVGENEPYAGHLAGDAIDRHGLTQGRPNVLIELRHDLIATAEAQQAWAARFAPLLEAARKDAKL
ncbi:MAG: N-formylglutamate amidohydrolase [Pseudomonadota bacterium]